MSVQLCSFWGNLETKQFPLILLSDFHKELETKNTLTVHNQKKLKLKTNKLHIVCLWIP